MNGTDPLALVTQLGILKALADLVNRARKEELGPQAVAAFPAGARLPIMVGGKQIGWLSFPAARKSAEVTSEARFLAWAKANCPTEVETIERVRPNFQQNVLTQVKDKEGWLDKGSGERIVPPGVTASEGDRYPRVEPLFDGAMEIIAEAWRTGGIDVGSLLALPAGEAGEAA